MISTAGNPNKRQHGFTYMVVLAALVVVAILVEVATVSNQYYLKREREAELLYRGQSYMRAIRSYYEAKPGLKTYPRNLEDLVTDQRFVFKRHLRALYNDPISNGDWRLIKAPDGGISGVVSASDEVPLKQANFPAGLEKFNGAQAYSDWVFEYVPASNLQNPQLPQTGQPGVENPPD